MSINFPNQSMQEVSAKIAVTGSGVPIQTIEYRSTNTYAAANWATQNELFTGSITPTSATSKILIYIYGPFRMDVGSTWSLGFMWVQNTTGNYNVITSGWNGTWRNVIGSMTRQYLDSPNSTATQNYSFRVGNYPSGTCYWNNSSSQSSDGYAYMRLTEIAA